MACGGQHLEQLGGRGRPGFAEVEQLLQVTVPLLDALDGAVVECHLLADRLHEPLRVL